MCAAVYARIAEDMNATIREKLSDVKGGANKIQAMLSTLFQYTMENPQKFKVIKNTQAVDFKNPRDKNVKEMARIDNEQLLIMRDNYIEAIAEGTVRPDVDPMMTTIFMRMALWASGNPASFHALAMDLNGIDRDEFMNNARVLITYATHTDAKNWIGMDMPPIGAAGKKAGTRRRKARSD